MTPPRWGEEANKNLPNSLHIVAPGVHGVGGECLRRIERQFLESGSVEGLDTSCVDALEAGKFKVGMDEKGNRYCT